MWFKSVAKSIIKLLTVTAAKSMMRKVVIVTHCRRRRRRRRRRHRRHRRQHCHHIVQRQFFFTHLIFRFTLPSLNSTIGPFPSLYTTTNTAEKKKNHFKNVAILHSCSIGEKQKKKKLVKQKN